MKLRTGAVRARCVSARRAALTRALDMLPRAAKSGVRMQAVLWRANQGVWRRTVSAKIQTNYKQPD